MKKLVSLLMALALCLCALTPVMAESTVPAAFSYTLDEYRVYFDSLALNQLNVTPEWTIAADGRSATAELPGFVPVQVEINEDGKVTRLTAQITATPAEANVAGTAFGNMMALISLSSKATEDIAYLMDSANSKKFATDVNTHMSDLVSHISEAMNGPVSISGELAGNHCTLTLSIDVTAMTMTFGFAFEP